MFRPTLIRFWICQCFPWPHTYCHVASIARQASTTSTGHFDQLRLNVAQRGQLWMKYGANMDPTGLNSSPPNFVLGPSVHISLSTQGLGPQGHGEIIPGPPTVMSTAEVELFISLSSH